MSEQAGNKEEGRDPLNEIGVLTRREIEARIVGPLLDALGREFGRDRVVEIAREVIVRVAREQGAQLAVAMGGNSMSHFADSMAAWKKGDAIEIDVLERNERHYHFNVTRCRYAEMYRALGLEELGATLSCNRDGALIEGFNSRVTLTRTQTILQGASHCDFRFDLAEEKGEPPRTREEEHADRSFLTSPHPPDC